MTFHVEFRQSFCYGWNHWRTPRFYAEFRRYKYCVWHRTVTSYQGACKTTTCHAFQARQGFDSLDPIYYSKPLSKLRIETFYWLLNVYIYTKKTHAHPHHRKNQYIHIIFLRLKSKNIRNSISYQKLCNRFKFEVLYKIISSRVSSGMHCITLNCLLCVIKWISTTHVYILHNHTFSKIIK